MDLLQRFRNAAPDSKLSRRLNAGLTTALAAGLLVIFLLRGWYPGYLTGIVWAGACVAIGALVGFLFGIPRTPATVVVTQANVAAIGNRVDVAAPENQSPPPPPEQTTPLPFAAESNLEQISDWVTKLLVGGSLTQLQAIPGHFASWGAMVALGLMGPGKTDKDPLFPSAQVIGTGLILYFLILGFFGGYLITVLQLRSRLVDGQRVNR